MENYTLGIDIGGTFIKYALVDDNYNIINKWKAETINFNTKDEFYDHICTNIKYNDKFDLIGVSAPGLIDKQSSVKSYAAPNVRIMYGTNINSEIEKRTDKKTLSINDAKSAGLCEFTIGNAKGSSSSAFLILGTGTGGCLCDKNNVILGKDSFAGEFHNITYIDPNTKKLAKMGDNSSITGLINIYNEKVSDNEKIKYGTDVCEKYLQGDETAKTAIEEWINHIVAQLIAITVTYNPEIICIGGGISEEKWFISKLKEQYKSTCIDFFELDFITTKIEKCNYNNDANILGAVINAKNNNL